MLHGYQRQANLFVAIAIRTDLPKCYYQCNFVIGIYINPLTPMSDPGQNFSLQYNINKIIDEN